MRMMNNDQVNGNKKILVGACLAGRPCRYDGNMNCMLFQPGDPTVVLICPEVEGGLPVPREPAEILGGDGYDVLAGFAKVVTRQGKEVTKEYVKGAEKALDLCLKQGVTHAVLKSKSPSCGSGKVYDGTFSGTLKEGFGVTAALLAYNGIRVTDEHSTGNLS